MILLGAFVVQFVASMLCMITVGVYVLFVQGGTREDLSMLLLQSINDYSMIISLVYAVIAIGWCGTLYYRWQWRERSFSYRERLGGVRIASALALGFGACIVLTVIVGMAAQLFPSAFSSYEKLMDTLDITASVFAVPYVMLVGPVAEELIFRGVILDRLKPAFSFWTANVIQAALFGIFHMNVIQGLYAFALGILLGMVVQVTGTIFASMIMHITFNSTSIGLSLLEIHAPEVYSRGSVLIVASAAVCFIIGLRYYAGQYRKRDRA
jgi:membrane protease YdiL (CAAX protease family)